MNYFGKLFTNFREFYSELNTATLTGAIDVVVVRQADGSYRCSPFHVRFGKLGVLKAREKVVDIEINGEPVDIHMKLGETGEAFFVQETTDEAIASLQGSPQTTSPVALGSPVDYDMFESCRPPRLPSVMSAPEDLFSLAPSSLMEDATERITPTILEDDADNGVIFFAAGPDAAASVHQSSSAPLKEDGQSPAGALSTATQTPPKASQLCYPDALEDPAVERTLSPSQCSLRVSSQRRRRQLRKRGRRKTSSSSDSVEDAPVEDTDAEDEPPNIDSGCVSQEEEKCEGVEARKVPVMDRLNYHPFSDTDYSPMASPLASRPNTPVKSDTEYEMDLHRQERAAQTDEGGMEWSWGQLPKRKDSADASESQVGSVDDEYKGTTEEERSTFGGIFSFMRRTKKLRHQPEKGGIYLNDLDLNQLDPQTAALYFPPSQLKLKIGAGSVGSEPAVKNPDQEGIGDLAISLCGDFEKLNVPRDSELAENLFLQYQVSFDDLAENASTVLSSPDLVVRMNGRYLTKAQAEPTLWSWMLFKRPLTAATPEVSPETKPESKSASRSWFAWNSATRQDNEQGSSEGFCTPSEEVPLLDPSDRNVAGEEPSSHVSAQSEKEALNLTVTITSDGSQQSAFPRSADDADVCGAWPLLAGPTEPEVKWGVPETPIEPQTKQYFKTLRLTSAQIVLLNLQEGPNEAVFSVTTAFQGTTRCWCNIFLWEHTDKVIVSDIDGTITKSDVLGHILPIIGRDWAQSDVAQLFTKISGNGYRFLYLSARAIGQAHVTREYLRSIRQGDVCLPNGPLLLNPASLISAFHREVIVKKPEEFKISCLRDIQQLFSTCPSQNPFYAGYGNRVNDVWAYRAVGIPIHRIFTINPKGEIRHELTRTFQTSYGGQAYMVDHVFPPIVKGGDCRKSYTGGQYADCVYWKSYLPDPPPPPLPPPPTSPIRTRTKSVTSLPV